MEELAAMFPAIDGEVIAAVLRETRNDGEDRLKSDQSYSKGLELVSPSTDGVLAYVHQLVLQLKGCWRCHPVALQSHLLPLRALSGHKLPEWSNHRPQLGMAATSEDMGLPALFILPPTT